MTDEEDNKKKMLENCVNNLIEHFDYVSIIAGYSEEKVCSEIEAGSGNIYARVGHMKTLIAIEEARVKRFAKDLAKQESLEDNDEEEEEKA